MTNQTGLLDIKVGLPKVREQKGYIGGDFADFSKVNVKGGPILVFLFTISGFIIPNVTQDLLKEVGFDVKPKTIEEEYQDMVKTTDTKNWKNIRGPRPWEEPTKEYLEMIEKRAAEQKSKIR